MALQSETKICPSDVVIIHAGLCDLLRVFSSETPLQCKLINTTFASFVYNKVVIIATFLDTLSPHGPHNCGVVVIFKPASKLS